MKKRYVVLGTAFVAAVVVPLTLALTQSSNASAATLPALTTVSASYVVPGTDALTVDPQPVSKLAAQTASADSLVKSLCATPGPRACVNATPAVIQSILFSDTHDPSNQLLGEPAYLLQWPQTGRACLEGLGGPQGQTPAQQAQLGKNAVCTWSIAVDAATGVQLDGWER